MHLLMDHVYCVNLPSIKILVAHAKIMHFTVRAAVSAVLSLLLPLVPFVQTIFSKIHVHHAFLPTIQLIVQNALAFILLSLTPVAVV
jgi:hypothetical protein